MVTLDFKVKITRFYPYEAVTLLDRFLSLEDDAYHNIKREFENELSILHGRSALECEYVGFDEGYCRLVWDNKITFQIVTNHGKGTVLYVQFYDCKAHFGTTLEKRNYDPETHYLKIL